MNSKSSALAAADHRTFVQSERRQRFVHSITRSAQHLPPPERRELQQLVPSSDWPARGVKSSRHLFAIGAFSAASRTRLRLSAIARCFWQCCPNNGASPSSPERVPRS